MKNLLTTLKTLALTNLAYLLSEPACRPYKTHISNLIFYSKYDL